MSPSRRDLIGAGLLFVILTSLVVVIVLGAIPPGGPPALR